MARANPFRFSTKYQDDQTDLLYYGYRYYSPNTGRWISRDQLGENAGLNLYRFASGDAANRVDALGLLETRFRGNSGTIGILRLPVLGGWWSSPRGFGEGGYAETDTSLSNWIHFWSGPAISGICNSIIGTLPEPRSQAPGEPAQFSQHAGAFTFEARDACRGRFRLYLELDMVVNSKGPSGNAKASVWIYTRGETTISVIGDGKSEHTWFGTYVDVELSNKWEPLVYYYPTISFSTTMETPLKESDGKAFGYVGFIGFDAL
jgi:RHS repeat-associated protein